MSKELEALNELSHRLASVDTSKTIEEAHYDVFPIIRKALTPPTADEVCEALSEYLGCDVTFKDNVFWYKTIIYDNEQWVRDISLKDLSNDKRFDLITLIGRFYEGLEK
ncbi:MAG: hypothetical protein RBR50_10145 [Candidatus Izemoplasmatales bacterium]|nr:hypothetical protein [Candidatus Izemoplasmatales bacterium]